MQQDAERPTPPTKRDLGPEAQRTAMKARRELFLGLFDFTDGRGLEIGPLDASISDPEQHDVRYVDVFDTEGIREHYAHDPNVVLELIPPIDFPLHRDGRVLSLAEAAAPGAPYDWVIASHVIEHVPDVIGWLEQLASVTTDDARLLMAVPDRRYCFDRHRPPTTTGEALLAYQEGHTRPSVRAVYDFFSTAVAVNPRHLWSGKRPPGRSARIHGPDIVRERVEQARAGEYVDCHVWTYTPQSLLEQVKELRGLGLCQWYVERLEERRGTVEFLALLRRVPQGATEADLPEPELASDLPDWLEQEWRARSKVKELRAKLRDERERSADLRRRLDAAESSGVRRVGRAVVRRARRLTRGSRALPGSVRRGG